MPEKYNFKCLSQGCNTQACHTRKQIRVTLGDITRWTTLGQIESIAGRILISVDIDEPTTYTLMMLPKQMKSDPEKLACTFYDEEHKLCQIDSFRPISCQTYPLEYDGEKFYVSDKNCPGVGQGEITKEALQEAKSTAEKDYNERMYTRYILPSLYSIIMTNVMIQSEVARRELSEEDRAKLDEIQKKMESGSVGPEKPKTGEEERLENEREKSSHTPKSDDDSSTLDDK